jgi:predicted nucleotidyltransferase
MGTTKKERVEDFFSMVEAEISHGPWRKVHGFLVFGSYTRGGESFSDVDIMGIVGDYVQTLEELEKKSLDERERFSDILRQGEVHWNIPQFQNQGFLTFLKECPRDVRKEIEHIRKGIEHFYDFYAGFNKLDSYSRSEYGIGKPPADFRFSPKHVIWKKADFEDRMLCHLLKESIREINPQYDKEISEYPTQNYTPASRIFPSS